MVDVDTLDFELAPGDTLLMCSDGFHEYTDEGELAGCSPPPPAREISERLGTLANERGGKDNITALVVRVDGADALDETDAPLDVFRGTPLFAGLSDGQLMRLMNLAFPVSVPAGEDSARPSSPPTACTSSSMARWTSCTRSATCSRWVLVTPWVPWP